MRSDIEPEQINGEFYRANYISLSYSKSLEYQVEIGMSEKMVGSISFQVGLSLVSTKLGHAIILSNKLVKKKQSNMD